MSNNESKPRPQSVTINRHDAEITTINDLTCPACGAVLRALDWDQTLNSWRRDCPGCCVTVDEIKPKLPIFTLRNTD
jgi:hypothetical protein